MKNLVKISSVMFLMIVFAGAAFAQKEKDIVVSITISPEFAEIELGEKEKFEAKGYNSDGDEVKKADITLTVSDGIGVIEKKDEFLATSIGSGFIVATDGVVSAQASVTVYDPDDYDDDDNGRGIEIRVDGGWTDLSIGSADLIGGAGTDFIDTYTSNTDAGNVDIHRAKKNDYWRIDIRRSDINWFENLNLYARRTGSGNGNGNASGGLSYVEVNYIDREFFSGRGLLNNISLQYQLSGVSVQVPPDIYSTMLIFTIVEL
ncbi:hypothetical protein ACFL6K_03350 [Candidatus Latescibacterota bacterium]